MKHYHSIPHCSDWHLGQSYIAFDKIDGSNIRIEFNHKKGFTKFGTRNILMAKDSDFSIGEGLFLNKYADRLSKIFFTKEFRNSNKITIFAELIGDDSFAGWHDFTKPLDIKLFDIWLYKKGFIEPKTFIEMFSDFDIPKVISSGILDYNFINWVKENKELSEGVICKGVDNKQVWMCKIKTKKWLDRLKNNYGEEAIRREYAGQVNRIV